MDAHGPAIYTAKRADVTQLFENPVRISAINGFVEAPTLSRVGMGHKPQTMSELYSQMDHELQLRLQQAESVGVGFTVPAYVAPKCSKISAKREIAIAA